MTNTLLIPLLLLCAANEALAAASGLTLEEAFLAATTKTEEVPLAESRLRQSEAQTDRARGALLPTLSAGAAYDRQETRIGSTGKYDQGLAKLTLSQSLYAGGKDSAGLEAARANARAQELNLTDSRNKLYAQVARVFYGLLSAKREVENIQKSIELIQRRIDELKKRMKIGKSRRIEILAAESQRAVLEAQLVAATAARRIAKNDFFNVTGLDRNSELRDGSALPAEVGDRKALLGKANDRPDVQSLVATLESSEHLVRAAKSGYLPNLDLTANYYPSRYHYPSTAPDWDAGLSLTIPLYSGGTTSASLREAQESRLQAELQLSQRRRNAQTEIHTAYNNLTSSIEQVKALEKAVSATEQNYREQEKDYRYSLATNLDVLQALNTYYDTMRTLDRTRYDALRAAAELKAALNEREK